MRLKKIAGCGVNSYLRPAVFLDRDGVLNRDFGYVYEVQNLEFIKDAPLAIRYLQELGFLRIIVTNQSGVARGVFSERDMVLFHKSMKSLLSQYGASIDGIMYCPYHPEGVIEKYSRASHLRKPNAGMIERAIRRYKIDRNRSFLIGDKGSDMTAARRANIDGYLFDPSMSLMDFVMSIDPISYLKRG